MHHIVVGSNHMWGVYEDALAKSQNHISEASPNNNWKAYEDPSTEARPVGSIGQQNLGWDPAMYGSAGGGVQ
jgi:hypothetical protein